ncbi:MAG: c-type cytochrome [Betaproteobacteria bacterium]|jgi:cytochrome c5|nr:c-type cytochrome [Betaproteobacteria bacterium]
MSAEMTSHDPEDHASFIKTPRQLITIVVLAFLVPVVLIILLAKAVVSMRAPDPAVLAPEAVAMRIKPVADVAIDTTGRAAAAAATLAAQAPAPAASAPAPAAQASATGAADGKAVYNRVCVACHQAGVAGAPKFGDKAAWAPRIGTGMDALYASVLKGKGAMPPKAGQPGLADAEIKAAVDYMVAAAK